MSKITASPDISQIKPEDVQRFVDIFCHDVESTINGQLDFATNFNAKLVAHDFATMNDSTAIPHGLGRVPIGYILTRASVALTLYDGTFTNTADTIYLKSTAIGHAEFLVY